MMGKFSSRSSHAPFNATFQKCNLLRGYIKWCSGFLRGGVEQ